MKQRNPLWLLVSVMAVLSLVLAACGPGATEAPPPAPPAATQPPADDPTDEPAADPTDEPAADARCMGSAPGDEVTVLYQWSGAEEENFSRVIAPLVEACGLVIVPESTRDQAVLDTRIQSGTPWDIVIWPNTGPVNSYGDQLVALDSVGGDAANYAAYWTDLGSANGAWLAVPVKADIKTIIWYSPSEFAAAGYAVPTTFAELEALVEQMVTDGRVPWSMGMESGDATGWTGSDFIQDLLLAQQGPDYVMGLLDGSVRYNDAGVLAAYETYSRWATDPLYTVGGSAGTLGTGFLDAIIKPFADPPEAMMVKQSGFAGGVVAEQFPELEYGVDYDFFGFPGAQGMQGGADWMMVFSESPATQAVVAYLTSLEGGAQWASVGFDLSPNNGAVGNYADVQLAKKADLLASASGFTPDIGDSITPSFGSAEWAALVDVVSGASDIQTALDAAAAAQADDLGLDN